MTLPSLLWLLPIVFMIHDFEEIIMIKPWMQKNAGMLERRFPALAKRMLPHLAGLSQSAFALAVAEEFVVLSVIAWVSVEYRLYSVWAGVLIAFGLHLVMHVAQFAVLRQYVPVFATSLPGLAFCGYALARLNGAGLLNWIAVALWTVAAVLFVAINFLIAIGLARRFDAWLKPNLVP